VDNGQSASIISSNMSLAMPSSILGWLTLIAVILLIALVGVKIVESMRISRVVINKVEKEEENRMN
jgi:hypothetical protein